ncbi:MAG: LysR family transcriptional regulator [Haliea sp.]|uniref:LysR family transcriptional regulator n=1 Tax=Haliea sp. TaxID=1932666 RepID=UPI0032EE70BF
MDTELLRTFLEVCNTRHFGRAAESLFITQAAVSARIKQLEEALGVTLFIRHRNNIQLSSEGERLVPHAETVLLALARAREEVRLEDARSSQFYLGVRIGIWSHPLQQRLHALHREAADLALRIESRESGELIRKLLERTLDLAIAYEPPGVPELESVPIGRLTLRLYSSRPDDTLEEALAGNYVFLDWGGGFARFHAKRFGEQRPPRLYTNLNGLASDFLTEFGGACFLPASLLDSLGGMGLTPVATAPSFSRPLNLVYHSSSPKRAQIDRVARYFQGVEV